MKAPEIYELISNNSFKNRIEKANINTYMYMKMHIMLSKNSDIFSGGSHNT